MLNAAFGVPDLTTFCNLDALGLTVAGQRIDAYRAVLECRAAVIDDVCRGCVDRARSVRSRAAWRMSRSGVVRRRRWRGCTAIGASRATGSGSTSYAPQRSKQVEVVAMDGFAGFNAATAKELPTATAVMDPFHVVTLACDALDQC